MYTNIFKHTRNHYQTTAVLSSVYGVAESLISKALQAGELTQTEKGISLSSFRKWCINNNVPCSKQKKCKGCGKEHPAYYFSFCKKNSDGLSTYCINCRYEERVDAHTPKSLQMEKVLLSVFANEYGLKEEEIIRMYTFFTQNEVGSFDLLSKDILIERKMAERCLISYLTFKRCSHCGRILRYSEFYAHNGKWHGCQSWCKDCNNKNKQTVSKERQTERQANSELDALLQKYPSLRDRLKSA